MSKGFGGFPGGGNMQAMLQQAQKVQKEIEKAQLEIAALEIEGQAGGGAVVVLINGEHEMLKIEIKPEVIDPSDREMLQDLIRAAANDARMKLLEAKKSRLAKATGGLPIPGLG
jgi:DNA-binding YbaB/EbfC family protein